MSQTRKSIASVVILTALGAVGFGGYQVSQIEPPHTSIGTVSVDVDEFTADDFAKLDQTPRTLHKWMKDEGSKQIRKGH